MKNLFTIFLLFISVNLFSQSTIALDTIENDFIFSDTVYLAHDVFIDTNVTVTFLPGTKVISTGNYGFYVKGNIRAIGNEGDSVFFTRDDTTGFSDTSITAGGGWKGFYFIHTPEINDSSIFSYCHLEYGKACDTVYEESRGGLFTINNFKKFRISHSFIINNIAKVSGGGILMEENSSGIISNNKFFKNITYNYESSGGAIFIFNNSDPLISKNLFKYNEAWGISGSWISGAGAAIACSSADLASVSPSIIGNRCFNNISVMGVIYESTMGTVVSNNLVCNNYGTVSNGHQLSQSIYTNNTIVNNFGIQVFISSNQIIFYNNIIWGNRGGSNYDSTQIRLTLITYNHQIQYNCVEFGWDDEPNNISSDPMFVNPSPGPGLDYEGDSYDWHLLNSSACINAGNPDTSGLFLPVYDLDGNPRIYGQIDMGAYENQSISAISSIDMMNNTIAYPNPTTDFVYFTFAENQQSIKTVSIYNMQGQIVKTGRVNKQNSKISLKSLPAGLYFYRITENNKLLQTGKIVKQ